LASKNGGEMHFNIIGKEGDYLVKNSHTILQYKKDNKGSKTGECIIHIITDSIENNEDRKHITKIIEKFNIN
jgi:hypothetical protein